MNFMAEKKREEGKVVKKLEIERKNLNDHISSASRMIGEYKEKALERINEINSELNCIDSTKREANARKMLAKYHLEAETPTKAFCAQVASQKKKIRLSHLRKKRKKKPGEEKEEDKYDDLLKHSEIMKEVKDFYEDLYKKRQTNPVYAEIVEALGPGAIKQLTEIKLKKTEAKITMEELTTCLAKTRNNVAPGSSGFSGAFYKVFWVDLRSLVLTSIHCIIEDNTLPSSQR